MSGPWIIDAEWWLDTSVLCHPVKMLRGVRAFFLGGLWIFAIMIADILAAEGICEDLFTNALWKPYKPGGWRVHGVAALGISTHPRWTWTAAAYNASNVAT